MTRLPDRPTEEPEIPVVAPTIPEGNPGENPGVSAGHDPYAALRFSSYRLYATGTFFWSMGEQMTAVAVGWQVFNLTNSATALGLIGLVQATPILLLAMHAGHLADRVNRKRIVIVTMIIIAAASLALAVSSDQRLKIRSGSWDVAANHVLLRTANFFGERHVTFNQPVVPLLFLLLLIMGAADAFSWPARSALLPGIVPMSVFGNAVTWNSSIFQVSSMIGPALGGALIGIFHSRPYAYSLVYTLDALFALVFMGCLAAVPYQHQFKAGEAMTIKTLGAGVRFVLEKKIILATITLDLFAVLLGGAVALLPMYAKDILKVGPTGLGWLRAVPSVGAFAMALTLTHMPPMKRAGQAMLWAVLGFGAATIVFGFSTWFWLSMLMLGLTGAFDNISVVVRQTLVQVLTPDEMRGRVSAVNNVFIGSSNQLGALESGLTAAAFGPVASVVGGGIGTILVVALVAVIWPEVRRFGSLGDVGRE